MHRLPVQSRSIKAVAFDPRTHTLEIEFASGHVYDFADVPQHVYDELMHAASKSHYFNEHIRERYGFVRLGDIPLADVREEVRADELLGTEASDLDDEEQPALAEGGASHHSWIVQVLDDDLVAVQVDGREVTAMPRWVLPADARVNDLLRVSHLRRGTRSHLRIELVRTAAPGPRAADLPTG